MARVFDAGGGGGGGGGGRGVLPNKSPMGMYPLDGVAFSRLD